jgi:hypothetical protein
MTTSVASKRLFQEYKHLTQDPPDGITAGPVEEDDLFVWEALIEGPEGTPYEGGIFPAELKFPKDYPLMPPTMKFLSDIWHPNGMYHPTLHPLPLFAPLCLKEAMLTEENSVSQRRRLHLYPAPSRRRPQSLRTRLRALEPHPKRRKDLDQCYEHAG